MYSLEQNKIFASKQVKFMRFVKQGAFDTLVNIIASNGTISLLPSKNTVNYATVKTIYFKNKSENLEEKMKSEIKDVIDMMIRDDMKKLQIKSHSDSRGEEASNVKLTETRAQAIKNYLVSNGIEESKIEIQALGSSQPSNACKKGAKCSEKQHNQNSRVEFVLF